MLKKLYRKFIVINMSLVGIVVLFIFTALCVLTYRTEKQEIYRTLEDIISVDTPFSKPHDKFPLLGGKEPLPYVYAFSVTVGRNGDILAASGYGTEMENDVLIEATKRALSSSEAEGVIDNLLIYAKKETPLGIHIAFASMEHMRVTLKNTALIAGLACLGSLLIFYFVSRFLAKLAIRPIEIAWKQQQQFVADASHDLKTPLTVMLANLDILRAHKNESVLSQQKWLDSTAEEAERMHALTCKMLELAKSEDMKPTLIFAETNISELCERILLQFEPVAFEKNVSLEGDIEADIHLKSHEESFIRLIHILLDNAIKYSTDTNTVKLTLASSKKSVSMSVQNSAVISEEDLPHIFERFYRADKARGTGSFGLGLSIAKNLSEGLHGEIHAESGEENGTVFTVTFKK